MFFLWKKLSNASFLRHELDILILDWVPVQLLFRHQSFPSKRSLKMNLNKRVCSWNIVDFIFDSLASKEKKFYWRRKVSLAVFICDIYRRIIRFYKNMERNLVWKKKINKYIYTLRSVQLNNLWILPSPNAGYAVAQICQSIS